MNCNREGPIPTSTQAAIVDSLRSHLRDLAVVFWNASRGDIVGLVWKPRAILSSPFSILDSKDLLLVPSLDDTRSTGGSSSSGAMDATSVVNIAKVLADVLEIGHGLFGDIHIQ